MFHHLLDVGLFTHDRDQTGSLVSNLSDAPQKINGLAGITLGAYVPHDSIERKSMLTAMASELCRAYRV